MEVVGLSGGAFGDPHEDVLTRKVRHPSCEPKASRLLAGVHTLRPLEEIFPKVRGEVTALDGSRHAILERVQLKRVIFVVTQPPLALREVEDGSVVVPQVEPQPGP